MIPFVKIASLLIKLFTKPVSNYLKASLKVGGAKRPRSQKFLIYFGQKYHRFNVKLTRSLSNMSSTNYIKPLCDEKALDSGAEFIGELIAYGTLMTWGIYELNRLNRDAKIKEQKVLNILSSLQSSLATLNEDYDKFFDEVQKIREEIEASAIKPQESESNIELSN
ncbi:hypothetical protein SteCoe_38568 [Stentor coeruleus]|uniref:OPA3-like protein n=1 Tax=Stentor coeruleus TaxID=5963 RepID=A0A1R2ALC8_9CILI|nr:hypothetical protein SteCoe_38568 [Stentor coeruleus]